MCGRFVLATDANTLQQKFNLDIVPPIQARYNIAPSQPVAVISNENPREMTFYKWGLIPSWAKDPAIGNKMINARGETVAEKPSFRSAFKRRRCLIPASGFYEWPADGKSKTPRYIHMKDHEVFAFAGLWEVWHSAEGDIIHSCTIITSDPNELISPFHHRMAVILDEKDYDLWLSPKELPAETLQPLIRPYPADKMEVYEVSTLVNKPSNDLPDLIMPLTPPQQGMLL